MMQRARDRVAEPPDGPGAPAGRPTGSARPDGAGGLGALLLSAAALAGCGGTAPNASAEQDHAHAGGGAITVWTDSLELFAEYPPHVRDVPSDPWAIHITWLADWSPVREGSLTLLLRGPGGAREEIVMQTPVRPGVFTATPTLTATGTWRADMVLAARGRQYEIPVGQLQVFESEQALPHEEEESAPADLIPFLKEQQWQMPFGVGVGEEREIPRSIRAPGELVAPPGATAHVSAPVSGLVLARGPSPAPGQAVSAGQTLALLAPVGADDSYARLRADVERLEREVARAERLYAAEAIAEKRLEEARYDLEVAAEALLSLGGSTTRGTDEVGSRYVFPLTSPISGVVSERHVTPGTLVEPGTPAFTIVNPQTLWLRVRVPATDAAAASEASGAWFTVEGGTRAYTADRVISVGRVIDPETRTLPVHLVVSDAEGGLSVGMLADARLQVGDPVRGVAVPSSAIQDEDGIPVAYVKLGGEAFQRRVLEIGPSDGEWTIVRSGVAAGEQVVTTGAYQVRLASLGDAEISDHGHPH